MAFESCSQRVWPLVSVIFKQGTFVAPLPCSRSSRLAALSCSVALHAFGLGETLFEQQDGAQHKAEGLKEGSDDGFHGGEW